MERILNTKHEIAEARKQLAEAELNFSRFRHVVKEARCKAVRLEAQLTGQINEPLRDGTDITQRIPDDVLELVLHFLPVQDAFRSACVSRRWCHLIRQSHHRWPQAELRLAKYASGCLQPAVLRSVNRSGMAQTALLHRGGAARHGDGRWVPRGH